MVNLRTANSSGSHDDDEEEDVRGINARADLTGSCKMCSSSSSSSWASSWATRLTLNRGGGRRGVGVVVVVSGTGRRVPELLSAVAFPLDDISSYVVAGPGVVESERERERPGYFSLPRNSV